MATATDEYRAFIETVLGEMKGNAALALASEERTASGRLMVDTYHWFAYPGDLDAMVEFTVRHQDQDVYLSPIIYGNEPVKVTKNGKTTTYHRAKDGRIQWSRGKSNALTSHTIYMDSDTCPPEAFRLPPSLHVNTSEGHGHDYWILLEDVPAEMAADIAHRITTAHQAQGTDPSGWSANKVLRMPTVNAKDPENPYPITWADLGARYVAEDVLAVYEDVQVAASVAKADLGAAPAVEGLVPFEELVAKIPGTERRLADLLYKTPKRGEGGWQSQQRWALIMDLLRFGFNAEETVSLVWHAPAGAKWHDDDRSIEGLWMEVRKAHTQLEVERGSDATPAPVKPKRDPKACKLLTPAERARFEQREDFITDYLAHAREIVRVFNRPLHTINAWTILSIAFGEMAYIPKGENPLPLNLYSMTLAGSSEGKSEAKGIMFSVLNALFPEDNPDIGGTHSKNDLMETLLKRKNKVSFIHADEAHGRFAELKQGSWQTGIQELWTHVYDGKIPSLGKVGRDDLKVPDARGVPVMHMSGTLDGMLKVLDRPMFLSGYLARQIWVIGEKVELRAEDLMPKQVLADDPEKVYSRMPRYWGSLFFRIRGALRASLKPGQRQVPVHLTNEATERLGKAFWEMRQHFLNGSGDSEIFTPAMNRMNDILWKAAALLALVDGRSVISTEDVVGALGHAEEWLCNLSTVAEGIAETGFSRACNDIERFIASSKAQEVDLSAIYRLRAGEPVRLVDEYLTALKKQGRVVESQAGAGAPTFYKLRK